MKFGKSLSNQIEETLPEWRDKFLSYKDLKKRLKLISERPAKRARIAADEESAGGMTTEEEDFMRLLEAELDKFNSFFVEKEEEYIIGQKELQDRTGEAVKREDKEELMKVRKEIVDFHGEMVLLENYSALNYTGLAKILKKYDKRTGALMRLPFIQKVLQEPFFTTDLLNKLIKDSESMLDRIFPFPNSSISSSQSSSIPSKDNHHDLECNGEAQLKQEPSSNMPSPKVGTGGGGGGGIPDLEEIEYMESLYMKSTVAALRALKEIRSGSSTVSVFSLPPLQKDEGKDREQWTPTSRSSSVPVLEQAAK